MQGKLKDKPTNRYGKPAALSDAGYVDLEVKSPDPQPIKQRDRFSVRVDSEFKTELEVYLKMRRLRSEQFLIEALRLHRAHSGITHAK